MTAKVFVDSNILIYAHDADAGPKQKIAAAKIKALWEEQLGRISTQVLQEFYVTVTQKLGKPLAKSNAREIVRDYAQWVATPTTPQTVIRASEISEGWRLSFLGQSDSRGGRGAGLLHCAHRRLEFRSNGGRNPDHQSVFAKSRHSCLIVQ